MEVAVSASSWVVGKALSLVTGGLLEAWAASQGLGPNVDALKMELLYARAMLDNAREREIRSPALKELLLRLRQLAYDADDVLDELDYFRIQDDLDGTYNAADDHAGGCVDGLVLHAHQTARAVAAKLKPASASASGSGKGSVSRGDPARQGCLSSFCSCGNRTVGSSPPSPTNQDDQKIHGGSGFCGALHSKLQGCLSGGGACLCGKREISSSPQSPTDQRDKKVGFGRLLEVASTACNTAQSIGKRLPCCSSQSIDKNPNMRGNEKRFLCGARKSKVEQRDNTAQAPKLKFNRVEMSEKMKDIVEHLKPVCAKVSNILNLEFMGTSRITRDEIFKKRPKTTPDIIENELYGRDTQTKEVIDGITRGKYFSNELTILPIVGPGGIGKTTFTQHVYDQVKDNFEVSIWICVSLNFNAARLAQEAVKRIPKVDGDKGNGSDQELIEQRLKAKRFLLVLDDMWACNEDEWRKLLVPFGRGGKKGNMIIITTRILEVAKMVKTHDCLVELDRLEHQDFKRFFEVCIFGCHDPWKKDHAELQGVGEQIIGKLKGFPLAAKTVGRLLRGQLTLEHWTRVLESKEWELQTNENDIMPALKLSYDYLPFHLQQCFYYCALFPEDYEYNSQELIQLWIGLDIIHPSDLNSRIEDVGLAYLNELVNHGFFKKNERDDGSRYYVVHDLLHNLAVKISLFECLSVYSSNVKSTQIPQDVRHLSIIIDNNDVKDIKSFKYYRDNLSALIDKRLKVGKLRTLMLFGEHHGSFMKTFSDLFDKAKALRAIYLSEASYVVEGMLQNFSKLIHLRYLRIKSYFQENTDLFRDLSRLYHLEVIDLHEWEGCNNGFTRHTSNLTKLRHFLVPQGQLQLHSKIVEVGKLKLLQELRSFEIGKESKGFEVSQLGHLSELGGSLTIYNLERIQETEEATEARLTQMNFLHKLILEWGANGPKRDIVHEENALEILIPPSNLQDLCIRGHRGVTRPSWLGEELSVKNLESLELSDVSWKNLPPLGELWLIDEHGEEYKSTIPGQSFKNLKRLELAKILKLKKWTGNGARELFSHLKVLIIKGCPELMEWPFSDHNGSQIEDESSKTVWFPKLEELEIEDCPKLTSFPCIPWSSTTRYARIEEVGLGGLKKLVYKKGLNGQQPELTIYGEDGLDSALWKILAFDNLSKLEILRMTRCTPLSLDHLGKLSSLKSIMINDSLCVFHLDDEGDDDRGRYQFPVEDVWVDQIDDSGADLTRELSYFPKLSSFSLWNCDKLTGLGVVGQIGEHEQEDARGGEDEIAGAQEQEGTLLLPSQLQDLEILKCPQLCLRSNPLDCPEPGGGGGGVGLQGLTSLRSLSINDCPKFFSRCWPSSSASCFPFPSPLTSLMVLKCGYLRFEGLWPLLAQGRLTQLTVRKTCNFFAGFEPPRLHEQEPPSPSPKLQEFETDDVAGFLATPICTLLSASLTSLAFCWDKQVERFSKEQGEALQLLTSLQKIIFGSCDKLQCLPSGLHTLSNLKRLSIYNCAAIRSLPKDGLPSSLQVLYIQGCPAIRSLPEDGLPNSLQELTIARCPAIRSLPKDRLPTSRSQPKDCLPSSRQKLEINLPSSLRILNVRASQSEELKRQCRELIGTIPIVRA